MKLTNCGIKLNDNMICEFEQQLGIKLPSEYKEFLLKNNGGKPEGNWSFDFIENGTKNKTESVINYFEKIYDEKTIKVDDLRVGYLALVESEQIPNTLLPIADDPFGNIIFLCIGGDDFGKVYFGNHELEDPETGYIVMSLISDSFENFIDKLHKC